MKSRSRSVLATLISLLALPLISLVVLWGIAASASLGPGISLLRVNDQASAVALPLQDLTRELRAERLESVVSMRPGNSDSAPLRAQRARTDQALARFRDKTINGAGTDALQSKVDGLLAALDSLPEQRAAVDRRAVARLAAADYFTRVLDRTLSIVLAIRHIPIADYAVRASATLRLIAAIDAHSEEAAILAAAVTGGRFEGDGYTRVVQLIGAQRRFFSDGIPQLTPDDQKAYQALTAGPTARLVRGMEDTILKSGRPNGTPPIDADAWINSSRVMSAQLEDFGGDVTDRVIDDLRPAAIGILVRIAVAGVLGLVAVLVSVLVSVRIGRSLVRELVGIRRSALGLATDELPSVVRRLRAGASVDVSAEVRPLTGFTIREIEGIAEAMDAARATAVEVAVEEAQLRRGVREVFLNLARRSQALIHRQLTLLDTMERREKDPDELNDLFQLDHLATRMRRHAEDLIVLSGSTPGRGWRNPVPLIDVMRGAVAEIEDYARVRVVGATRASLAGRGVSDVIHLLAELIENATVFSPPHTTVHVSGELVPAGFAIEIEDRGLGMPPEQLAAVNARLAEPPEFDLLHSERLGLFVVGQLARRHDIRVILRGSPFGGTTAIVLLPASMVITPETPVTGRAALAAPRPVTEVDPDPPRSLSIAPELPADESDEPVPTGTPEPLPPAQPFQPASWSSAADEAGAASATNGVNGTSTADPAVQPVHAETAAFEPEEPAQAEAVPIPPLARREPGAGWEHLSGQVAGGWEDLARQREMREFQPTGGWDSLDVRPRGVARAPLASRGVPDAARPTPPAAPPASTAAPPASVPAEPAPAGLTVPPAQPAPDSATPSGLPRRIRQASLAAPLRTGAPIPPTPLEPVTVRPPEEIRGLMASYQRGSVLGRKDAARTIGAVGPTHSVMDDQDPVTARPSADHGAEPWPDGQPRPGEVTAGRGPIDGALEGER